VVAALEPRTLWGLDDRASEETSIREICAAAGDVVMTCTDDGLDRQAISRLVGASGVGTFETRP
jgi:hypothetical protein